MMNTHDYIPVIKTVLTDMRVIVTAVIVFIFMDICAFVVKYRKKPKAPRAKKSIAVAAPKPAENSDAEGGDGADGDGE